MRAINQYSSRRHHLQRDGYRKKKRILLTATKPIRRHGALCRPLLQRSKDYCFMPRTLLEPSRLLRANGFPLLSKCSTKLDSSPNAGPASNPLHVHFLLSMATTVQCPAYILCSVEYRINRYNIRFPCDCTRKMSYFYPGPGFPSSKWWMYRRLDFLGCVFRRRQRRRQIKNVYIL